MTEITTAETGSDGLGRHSASRAADYSIARSRWSRISRVERVFVICGVIIIIVFVAAAVDPHLFARQNPDSLYAGSPLVGPSVAHWLGTDELGRDFFSRLVYGARPSLTMSVLIVAIGASSGTVVGVVAAFVGGRLDEVLMRMVDLFLALPGFVLALALAAVLGRREVGRNCVKHCVVAGLSASCAGDDPPTEAAPSRGSRPRPRRQRKSHHT